MKEIVGRFQSSLLNVDKESAQILKKYPKYLTSKQLLSLQF